MNDPLRDRLSAALLSWRNHTMASDELAGTILDAVKLERDAGSPIADRLRELVEERDRLKAELDESRELHEGWKDEYERTRELLDRLNEQLRKHSVDLFTRGETFSETLARLLAELTLAREVVEAAERYREARNTMGDISNSLEYKARVALYSALDRHTKASAPQQETNNDRTSNTRSAERAGIHRNDRSGQRRLDDDSPRDSVDGQRAQQGPQESRQSAGRDQARGGVDVGHAGDGNRPVKDSAPPEGSERNNGTLRDAYTVTAGNGETSKDDVSRGSAVASETSSPGINPMSQPHLSQPSGAGGFVSVSPQRPVDEILANQENAYIATHARHVEPSGAIAEGDYTVTREQAKAAGINLSEHECPCEVCARSSQLCPASQSSIFDDLREKLRTAEQEKLAYCATLRAASEWIDEREATFAKLDQAVARMAELDTAQKTSGQSADECPVCTDPNCASTPVTSREIIDDLRLRLRASEAENVNLREALKPFAHVDVAPGRTPIA